VTNHFVHSPRDTRFDQSFFRSENGPRELLKTLLSYWSSLIMSQKVRGEDGDYPLHHSNISSLRFHFTKAQAHLVGFSSMQSSSSTSAIHMNIINSCSGVKVRNLVNHTMHALCSKMFLMFCLVFCISQC